MILQELVKLAEREGLIENPDYEWKAVPWIVDIDCTGKILGVISTRETPPGQKKAVAKSVMIPRSRGKRASGIQPEFLVDNSRYLFGFWAAKKEEKPDRVRMLVESMLTDLRECLDATGSEAVQAQLTCMESVHRDPSVLFSSWGIPDSHEGQAVRHLNGNEFYVPKDWMDSDFFIFMLEGKFVHEEKSIQEYWANLRNQQESGPETAICLVTGKRSVPVDKHLPLQVRGATTTGAPLVSFNCSAFESYGLKRNKNAPISREASEKYGTALQRLLKRDGWPKLDGSKLPKGNIVLPSEITVLFWSEDDGAAMELFPELLEGNAEAIHGLYESVWKGRQIKISDTRPFHTLVLSGAQGRVILRVAETTTVGQVLDSLQKHFNDLVIVPRFPNDPVYPALRRLVQSMKPPGDTANTPPAFITRFYMAAITGAPYPQQTLSLVLGRIRAHDKEGVSTIRAGLIKAMLNRNHRKGFIPFPFTALEKDMDPNNKTTPYRLGRLFAVMERIQDEATHASAGVVDRFMGAACGTPALVFPRLMTNHHHHMKKIEQSKPGLAVHYGKLVDEIIKPIPGTFPRTLSLEEQGVFMIGYHHQRADLWKKKVDNSTASEGED